MYTVPSCSPLSTVLVVEDVLCTVEPLLGAAVTVYPVTGGMLSVGEGGVHVTLMEEPEVAIAVTLPGGGGAGGEGESRTSTQEWRVDRELPYTLKFSRY